MAIAEAVGIVTSLRNAADIVDRVRSGDTKEDLRTAGSELADLLVKARIAALDLIEQKALLMDERATLNERVQSLESENRKLIDFDEKSERYERVETITGKFVYREKGTAGGNAGSPYFCPTCFADKKARILVVRQNDRYAICHVCHWAGTL